MATDEFPIGQTLKAVFIVEYKEDGGDKLCLDQVQLIFQDTTVTLLPVTDTDEIEILYTTATTPLSANTPSWCQPFLGKKLMTVWVCENDQGYRDQVIFAFEYLRPSIAFIAECSSLLVFRCEPIYRVISETPLQHSNVS